jgi:hypothetical protein
VRGHGLTISRHSRKGDTERGRITGVPIENASTSAAPVRTRVRSLGVIPQRARNASPLAVRIPRSLSSHERSFGTGKLSNAAPTAVARKNASRLSRPGLSSRFLTSSQFMQFKQNEWPSSRRAGLSQAAIARELGTSSSNLSRSLKAAALSSDLAERPLVLPPPRVMMVGFLGQ